MQELVINLHMHTTYSDGSGSHKDLAAAALDTGLDGIIVTDHNVLVRGPEGYYREGKRRLALLVAEEIHDRLRVPQKNHLLAFGVSRDLTSLADDPQKLINAVRGAGGLAFIAHPSDLAAPAFNEGDISWVDWEVENFTGLELWNGFSEFKSRLKSIPHGIFYAYFPAFIGRGPLPEVLAKWDELLESGKRIVAIGGSDAHCLHYKFGPIHKDIFPYRFHFRTVNTHILTPRPLGEDFEADKRMILEALAEGRAFIGYDLPGPTRGFRFTAQGKDRTAVMGGEIPAQGGVTLQVRLPEAAECRLLKDGERLKRWSNQVICTHITTEPGVYRVEVYRNYLGRKRGWIYSNPIYVR